MAASPDVYYLTDHYVNFPVVLVRLTRVHRDALRDLLRMGWQFVSSRRKRRVGTRAHVPRSRSGAGRGRR